MLKFGNLEIHIDEFFSTGIQIAALTAMTDTEVKIVDQPNVCLVPQSLERFGNTGQLKGTFMAETSKAAEGKHLSIRGLTHSYGGQNAISDISFEIEAGEIVALLGPSGCGKSTVLRAIAGLIQPKSGVIKLGGQDLANVSARSAASAWCSRITPCFRT